MQSLQIKIESKEYLIFTKELIPLDEDYEMARLEAKLPLSAEDLRYYSIFTELDIPLPDDLVIKLADMRSILEQMHSNKPLAQQNR